LAIWTGLEHTSEVLSVAAEWRHRCLLQDGSVFSESNLWTQRNISELKSLFVDHPILGNGSFYNKFRDQIEDARPEVSQLASETVWLLLLFVSQRKFGIDKKRERISEIWDRSGVPLPQSRALSDASLRGLANPGTAFLTQIWAEYGFLLSLLETWKALSTPEQSRLLSDNPWGLCQWVTNIPSADTRAFRHMFLYFCYPTHFERICSRNHKKKIYASFVNRLEGRQDPNKLESTPCNLDKSILEIRQVLQADYATEKIDFYLPPLRTIWLPSDEENSDEAAADGADSIPTPSKQGKFWIEKTNVRSRPDRSSGPHRVGAALWSPQRSRNERDIYANMRDVRIGDVVFHLTDRAGLTGVSVVAGEADHDFPGIANTAWGEQRSYRIPLRDYQPLDPPLSREAFFEDDEIKRGLLDVLNHSDGRGLFYNKNLELGEGGYLTEAPLQLVGLLNQAYKKSAGKTLPYVYDPESASRLRQPYTLEEAVEDLFLDLESAEKIVTVWSIKKNLILQGPPGVGKTFAARRLAFALIGFEAPERLGFVQFHQSYSYEDFIQGYRPSAGGFELRNGKFVDFCRLAKEHPAEKHVFIIDEINRGNLSKIFGELMMLIESDKRNKEWGMPLAYSGAEERFFVPDNVYLLGLMNTADRSLAVIDYALRRRFSFFTLFPQFESGKFKLHLRKAGISDRLVTLIVQRLGELNREIERDQANLGRGFCVGHSFFCTKRDELSTEEEWYRRILETEIIPLLEEYWFDSPARLGEWRDRLLSGF